ncbi:P-loop containing nucleoside triphosphate hydrolase protein [Martensiomyces pterosporus]|nr:P-loop containing nucleoside triphosphate hydrolase protein [Martensiomyces pterosporus]
MSFDASSNTSLVSSEEKSAESPISSTRLPILTWDHLNYDVKTKDGGTRRILHDISGSIYPGELVAIMGSSGAGKTTLLNILSGRVQGGRLYGDIKFGGNKRDSHSFKRLLAFVEQDDMLHPALTVEETLLASAQLRLPDTKYTEDDKRQRVTEILRQLRLTHVKDTSIGGYFHRGVSGGERKRASIGTELVTDPAILMLDEPSSGLDSSSAEMVVTLTKEMSRQRNLGTIMTIHQPSAEMVAKFDKLILLSQGKLVYMGPAKDAVPYFEQLGHPQTNANPANFYIDLMTIDFTSDTTIKESEERVQKLVQSFADYRERADKAQVDISGEQAMLVQLEPPPMNKWLREMWILFKREWVLQMRNRALVGGFVAQCIVPMLLIGFVFFKLGHSPESIQNRIGALFAMVLLSVFPVTIPIMTLIMSGRAVLLRERSGGSYRMSSYFVARSLSVIPLVFVPYFIMYLGIYFLTKFQVDAGKFFIGFAILVTILLASLGFAFAMAVLVDSMEIAHIITPLTLAMLMLFAGNMANASSVTPVLRWIKYVCMMYYGYSALVQNEFGGLTFSCPPGAGTCYRTGEEVIKAYSLGKQPIWECIVINLALAAGLYLFAYALLRWKAKPRYLFI